ncbi:hypothetical protein [Oerskovia sp. KBS0722]|uniref:hypothetical protein n=1 Tax=Oerskovia sp. KBS0722 TaxID=1179673 RepID=UPI00110E2C26|nr:hypothetical protein [Oerskovia sp. KBS0722]QDW63980.1 hypothetical protein FFI11_016990 [Oerskovia sp. KBS0722]
MNRMPAKSRDRKPFGWVAVLFSTVVLAAGLIVSLVTGQWWALLCATGLVIIPVAGRRRTT